MEIVNSMATPLELRVNQKQHLTSLLKIKRANMGKTVDGLAEELESAVVVMEQEDIAHCEKTIGVKAL